jgi:hypothetical protein
MALFTYQRYGYENQFSNKFENEFEDWFGVLAKKLHCSGDCHSIRLTQGDGKIDVYVINEQLAYQCYAPQSYSPTKAAAKIRSDFWGAYEHLDGKLKSWVFVHNHCTGRLDKDSLKAINDVKSEIAERAIEITILVWGKEDIWIALLERLDFNQLRELFGESTPVELDYDNLEAVLISLEREDYQPSLDTLSQPAIDKLNFNELGPSCKKLIEMACGVDSVVGDYFARCPNPELGEQIAERLRKLYTRLKKVDQLTPDEIFNRLQLEVGWKAVPDAKRQLASMAVLSYFFHQCDVFENVPEIQ